MTAPDARGPAPGTRPGSALIERFAATFAAQNETAARLAGDTVLAHEQGDLHLGRFQRKGLVYGWDSGVVGTALDAATSLPRSLFVPYPLELVRWRISVPYPAPAGSATVDVLLVAPDAAMSSAASITGGGVPTLSAGTSASGDALGVWPTTSVAAGSYLVARLLTAATVEVVELQLEARAT